MTQILYGNSNAFAYGDGVDFDVDDFDYQAAILSDLSFFNLSWSWAPALINKSLFFLFEGIHPPRLFHPLARVILSVKCCAGGRPARRRTGEEEDWRYSLLLTSTLRPPLALSHHASRHHWTLAGCLVQSVRRECL